MTEQECIIRLKNIFFTPKEQGIFTRKKSGKTVLKNISAEFKRNVISGISGESGSGKTTMAKLIAGIIKPDSGFLHFNFENSWSNYTTKPVQILFQNTENILHPLRTVNELIEEAIGICVRQSRILKFTPEELFRTLNINDDIRGKKGINLSGGERQRAALARIIAVHPEVLILDEPFAAQDFQSAKNLIGVLQNLNSAFNITIIVIAHNLTLLKNLCDEIFILYRGELIESGHTMKIFNTPSHTYTKFLLRAENYNLSAEELKSFPGDL
ncbi:MAG: hypothetical protein Kow0098_21650 [Ignavibacteriaceae bacterium]